MGSAVKRGVGVIGFIVTGAVIDPFVVPRTLPSVFPTKEAGLLKPEKMKLATIIINNTITPAVMEKYCLNFCSWG